MLFFVQHLFENLFINSKALYPLVAKHHVYKHCGNVGSDVILMPLQ